MTWSERKSINYYLTLLLCPNIFGIGMIFYPFISLTHPDPIGLKFVCRENPINGANQLSSRSTSLTKFTGRIGIRTSDPQIRIRQLHRDRQLHILYSTVEGLHCLGMSHTSCALNSGTWGCSVLTLCQLTSPHGCQPSTREPFVIIVLEKTVSLCS